MASEASTLKRKIRLKKTEDRTIIIALAISKRTDENKLEKISCKSGLPIGESIYDLVNDSYYVECADYLVVGEVAFGYEAEMDGIAHWNVTLPLPESVFRSALSEQTVQKLDSWKDRLPNRWKIQYVQMIGAF